MHVWMSVFACVHQPLKFHLIKSIRLCGKCSPYFIPCGSVSETELSLHSSQPLASGVHSSKCPLTYLQQKWRTLDQVLEDQACLGFLLGIHASVTDFSNDISCAVIIDSVQGVLRNLLLPCSWNHVLELISCPEFIPHPCHCTDGPSWFTPAAFCSPYSRRWPCYSHQGFLSLKSSHTTMYLPHRDLQEQLFLSTLLLLPKSRPSFVTWMNYCESPKKDLIPWPSCGIWSLESTRHIFPNTSLTIILPLTSNPSVSALLLRHKTQILWSKYFGAHFMLYPISHNSRETVSSVLCLQALIQMWHSTVILLYFCVCLEDYSINLQLTKVFPEPVKMPFCLFLFANLILRSTFIMIHGNSV